MDASVREEVSCSSILRLVSTAEHQHRHETHHYSILRLHPTRRHAQRTMKTSIRAHFLLLVLLVSLAVKRSVADNPSSVPDTSPLAAETPPAEGRGEVAAAGRAGGGGADEAERRREAGRGEDSGAGAAALLPKPEALQGSLGGLPAGQTRSGTTHQTQGTNLGRIPPSCALCSRERNLCRIISGIFTRSPLPYGYSLVTPVPAGVCNLTITEMKPSKNYFALRRSDGTYILNGNWDIKAAGEYEAGGTTFLYTPGTDQRGEQLSAPGPLREPVDFMLISQSPNPGIEYEYRVPLPEYGGNPAGGGLPGGSRPGHGSRRVPGVLGSSVVPSTGQRRPYQASPNLPSRTTSYGTRTPGQGAVFRFGPGTAARPTDTFMPLTPVLQPVVGVGTSSGYNSSSASLYPINPQDSLSGSPAATPRRWPPYLGVPQGSAVDAATRTAARLPGSVIPRGQAITPLATSRTGSLSRPWSPGFNPAERGRASPVAGSPFIPGQPYVRGAGGNALPAGSGKGLPGREREVMVSGENSGRDGRLVPSLTPARDTPHRTVFKATNHRAGQPGQDTTAVSPPTHRTRHRHGFQGRTKLPGKSPSFPPFDPDVQLTQPNTSGLPATNTSDSGGASRGRGEGGPRHRHRHKQGGARRNGKKRRKERNRPRMRGGGRFQWAEKGLGPCSRTCGGGNQTAILSCERKRNKNVVSDRRCAHLPRPESRFVLCNLSPCPAEWMPEEWGPCSVTCGMGVQTRPTVCKQVVSPTLTTVVPEGACLSPPAVPTSQVCELTPCRSNTPTWEAGPWTNCSAPCGLGTRSRQVTCVVEGAAASDERCNPAVRPVREEVCDMGSCATNTWFFSGWSEQCSEPCGAGVQTRRVHCLAADRQTSCPASERPDASRPCTGQGGCGGQWFVGSWGECSEACGGGRETRPVLCVLHVSARWKVVEEAQCLANERPQNSRECNVEPCTPVWFTSSWSQCSASCGGGIQRREVTCLNPRSHASPDCQNATKPHARRPCHLHACSDISPRPTHASTDEDVTPVTSLPPAGDEGTEGGMKTSSEVSGGGGVGGGGGGGGEEGGGGGGQYRDTSTEVTAGESNEEEEEEEAVKEEKEEEGESLHPLRTQATEEQRQEDREEEENELVEGGTTQDTLGTSPERNAQGDESFPEEEEEEEDAVLREEEEEEEEHKKRKRKRKKDRKKSKDRRGKESDGASNANRRVTAVSQRPLCIDRIKNCHLVFRARLCRLKYYNQLCCRTCTTTA